MPSPTKTRPIKPAKEGQPSKSTAARKRQSSARISAACEACKKRKTKCTGGPPPCQLCQSLGTECVIDLTLDMRRRAALQRTVDESKSYQDALNKLIDFIRDGSSPRFETLVEYVRGGASNQDIIDTVQHSHGALEDDSDNTSILQTSLNGAQSPPSEPVDDLNLLQGQTNRSWSADGEDKHMIDGESPLQVGKGKEEEPVGDVSSLLSRLKLLPTSDAELLLHRILELKEDGKQFNAGYAAAQHSFDSFSRDAVAPSNAERSMWHPALHLQSQSLWPEEQRQRGQNGPFQRRFSQLASTLINEDSSLPAGPSMSNSSQSRTGPNPSLETDMRSWPAPLQSPISPYVEFTGVPPSTSQVGNAWDLSIAQEDQMTRLRIPIHLVLPLIIPDDSILSNMYTNYVEGARQMLEMGVPLAEVLGPSDEVSFELFFRSRAKNDTFDCASWACDVFRVLPALDDYVRMASAYMLTFMMRWLLAPSQANYTKIPDMMKPTPSQRMIPHIGAIEMLPLGPVRDALVYHMRDWLSQLGKANLSVNWPFDQNAAVEHNPVTNTRKLTPKFIEHICEYDNWSISREFLNAFPELTGRIRVHG